jgi:putative transposase
MGAAVTVTRDELTPAQLRATAGGCEEPDQVRRLLAIALVLDDVPRRQAAEQCGMDRLKLVVAGPDPERDQVVRWRCADLRAEVAQQFGVEVREGTIGGWLRQLGLTRLQPRPCHPKKDPAAQEEYKEGFPIC